MFFQAFGVILRMGLFSEGSRQLVSREENMVTQPTSEQILPQVLWIGGSPCSGKSTISHRIAQIYVFLDYHLDAWSSNHFARRVAAGDAEAMAFLKMSMDQRWVERPVEVLVQE